MCGVVGVFELDGRPVDEALLRTMTGLLEHRGPDDEGYWTGPGVGFGHRRLSIIDLAGSPQPMASPDGAVTLTFNGEILNYQALRRELDHDWRTDGDTETIIASYLRHGRDAVRRFRGQWAFGLHDARTDELWLTRDRLGIIPLYYYADNRRVAFASEIKALLPALPSGPAVDDASLDAYLAHRSVPAPYTLFAGVRKLEPGTSLVVSRDGRRRETRYWSLPDGDTLDVAVDGAIDGLADALRSSVEEALVADVPVGAYLSGGVDSSLICALATDLRGRGQLDTFSAGFGDTRFDELPHARTVSDHLGTRHHEIVLDEADFEGLWPRLTWHRDAPVSEPADIAVFRLAELARQHVKVVLSGEGSDELFGGYPKYKVARLADIARRVPAAARVPALRAVERRLPEKANRLRIALRALTGASHEEYLRAWFAPFTEYERAELLLAPPSPDRSPPPATGRDARDRLLRVDCGPWLADNLLERGDRMSMAASLELRPPFLDPRVVEYAFSLPSDLKMIDGVPKGIVKAVARRHLPDQIVDRRKVGFRVPLDRWFRSGLRDMANDLIGGEGSFADRHLDARAVRRVLSDHDSGSSNEEIRIWTLLSLEVWYRAFFTGRPAGEGPAVIERPAVART